MPVVVAPSMPALGSIFAGDFRVERALGQGGMGSVFVATQLSTGRLRALKLMRPELVADETLRRRFEQEATVGARIRSDHVVEVIAAGVDEATGVPWLAMELLEGEDLDRLVARRGPLPRAEVREIVAQLAHALGAAHAEGIVHRDLKPENVFVAHARREGGAKLVKVLDFGIAKVVSDARPTATAPVGTLLWMAPEQAETEATIGPATDVWALGLIVFFMLTGKPYWSADASPVRLLKQLVLEPIAPASERARQLEVEAKLPAGFDAWFARCAARDPGARFGDAQSARAALEKLLGGDIALDETLPGGVGALVPESTKDPRAAPAEPARRRRAWLPAAAMVAAIGAAALAMRGLAPRSSPPAGVATTSASASAAPGDGVDHRTVHLVPLGDSPRRGAHEPLVTIVEIADFQCPFSLRLEDAIARILAMYPDDVAIVWKDLPLDFHPHAGPAARLARLARAERGDDGFWRAHDALFRSCTSLDDAHLTAIGHELGLDAQKVQRALVAPSAPEIDRDVDLAIELGVEGTPTYFVNGRLFVGAQNFEKVKAAVDEEIAKGRAIAARVPRTRVYEEIQKGAAPPSPPVRRPYRSEPDVPVRAGAHATIDVHQFGEHGTGFTALFEPMVQRMLAEYGDRIRFHWHDLPAMDNPASLRAARASRAAFGVQGNDAFWRMHAILLANEEQIFPGPRKPRGFEANTILEYAREAQIPVPYFRTTFESPEHAKVFDRTREAMRAAGLDPDDDGPFIIGGYVSHGGTYRHLQHYLERALAEAK